MQRQHEQQQNADYHLALFKRDKKFVEQWLQVNPDPKSRIRLAYNAILNIYNPEDSCEDRFDFIKFILEKVSFKTIGVHEYPLLILSCDPKYNLRQKLFTYFLEEGYNPCAQTPFKNYHLLPLLILQHDSELLLQLIHWAEERSLLKRMLLDTRTEDGETPLHVAVLDAVLLDIPEKNLILSQFDFSKSIVERLLETQYGKELLQEKNKEGLTASQLLQKSKFMKNPNDVPEGIQKIFNLLERKCVQQNDAKMTSSVNLLANALSGMKLFNSVHSSQAVPTRLSNVDSTESKKDVSSLPSSSTQQLEDSKQDYPFSSNMLLSSTGPHQQTPGVSKVSKANADNNQNNFSFLSNSDFEIGVALSPSSAPKKPKHRNRCQSRWLLDFFEKREDLPSLLFYEQVDKREESINKHRFKKLFKTNKDTTEKHKSPPYPFNKHDATDKIEKQKKRANWCWSDKHSLEEENIKLRFFVKDIKSDKRPFLEVFYHRIKDNRITKTELRRNISDDKSETIKADAADCKRSTGLSSG